MAEVTKEELKHARLMGNKSFDGFDLSGLDLSGVGWLSRCNLSFANLRKANLRRADLIDVKYDSNTRWPAGFTPPPSR